MSGEWKLNEGFKPVPDGTRVDVIYRECGVNIGVIVGQNSPSGSRDLTAVDWKLTGHEADIIKWRIHKSGTDQEKVQEIYNDLIVRLKKSAKIMTSKQIA